MAKQLTNYRLLFCAIAYNDTTHENMGLGVISDLKYGFRRLNAMSKSVALAKYVDLCHLRS